jgi:hypothetical protein
MDILINEKQYDSLKKTIKKTRISEAEETTNWNTFLDIVGLFDPTGIADATNAVLYAKQGNYTFAILAAISAFPYAGDLIGKSLMFLGKSSRIIKNSDIAIELLKKGDRLGAERILKELTQRSSAFDKLAQYIGKNSRYIQMWIQKNSNSPLLRLFGSKVLADWFGILGNIGGTQKKLSRVSKRIGSRSLRNTPKLSNDEAIDLLKKLKDAAEEPRTFIGLGGKPKWGMFTDPKQFAKFSWESFKKYPFSGGVPRFYGNRQIRSLMNRTKWYLGFLDYVGIGNFVGIDELEKELGTEEFNSQLQSYSQTPEAQENWESEMNNTQSSTSTQSSISTQSSTSPSPEPKKLENKVTKGVFQSLFPGLF